MKKLLLILLTICLVGCSSNEPLTPLKGFLKLEIDKIPSEYENNYNFTDLNIDVYLNKQDYLDEVNKIYSGNFNSEGKITISENLEYTQVYFVDIYTNDNHLSNWTYTDLNLKNGSDGNILITAGNGDYSGTILLQKESRILIGEWNFAGYDGHNHADHDRTEKTKLIINKDFSMSTSENYKTINYTVKYEYQGNSVKYISTTPSDDKYPYSGVSASSGGLKNPNGLSIGYDPELKFIHFHDYADEFLLFSK